MNYMVGVATGKRLFLPLRRPVEPSPILDYRYILMKVSYAGS